MTTETETETVTFADLVSATLRGEHDLHGKLDVAHFAKLGNQISQFRLPTSQLAIAPDSLPEQRE